ncbi:LacI family DNA-binding transcriptional regulator [Microbacterium panaciterrae]|uniref:LacI family DNA-binding transcriptional regulator n=1 Tax=Microbacterium panaciterrae TaxID=985759 RepID=A0ABP8PVM7_9MICO
MSTTESPERRGASPGPERSGKANLVDVARLARVSPATASRVLAGRSKGKAASHDRVLAAAEELGYVVNGLARSMMGVGRRSVAFVSAVMVGPTFATMAAAAEQVVTEDGHLFMLCTTHGDTERERALIESLAEQRVGTVLLVGSASTAEQDEQRVASYADSLGRVGAQLILCGRPPVAHRPDIANIDYDHTGGVRSAVEHLLGLGHRRIAYVGMTAGMSTEEQRFRGYRAGLDGGAIEIDEALLVPTENDPDAAATAIAAFLPEHPDVTAFVCHTDHIAIGAGRSLRAAGLSVPEHVSVIGFDDTPLVADLTPALTTVHAPFREVGDLAGRIAIGEPFGGSVVLPVEFIVRGSTGPAPR